MDQSNLSRLIFRSFKARGLAVSGDATKALVSVLSREADVEGSLRLILEELKLRIEKQDVKTNIIDVDTIERIVADLSSSEEDLVQESVQLFDAYNCPKLQYDEKQRNFRVITSPSYNLLGGVESRSNMYRERLLLAQQRLLRCGQFTLRGIKTKSAEHHKNAHELSTIESLLGSKGVKVLFGMLTQPEEGSWFLEDLGSTIKLDLSTAQTYSFFYTEGSIVIVQGELNASGHFQVHIMGTPPTEQRESSLRSLGISDMFGSGFRSQHMEQMKAMELQADDQLVIMISEIHLDKPIVLEQFRKILSGFEQNSIAPLYVLIGSFFSKSYFKVNNGKEIMKQQFNRLGDVIADFPGQQECAKFIFVPGPFDAGSNVAIPRKSIPELLVESLQNKVKHIAFASNPCRIRCFTQEIVVYREDLMKKMQRHLAVPLSVDDSQFTMNEQLVRSICSQGHLCPLPANARPIHWELDHAMRLFPLPDMIILADNPEQFTIVEQDCKVINPGSFSNDFSFMVYNVASRDVEASRVPE